MSRPRPNFPDLLTAGGALALLATASQLLSVYRDHDAGSAAGRFNLMVAVLPYFPVIVAAIVLLLWGSWATTRAGLRRTITILLGGIALLLLVLLPVLIRDAASQANQIPTGQVLRYRLQVVRYLLYFGVIPVLLLRVLWRYGERLGTAD
jgi:CDP-diglyceride synthetase